MGFRAETFFEKLAKHLMDRKEDVRSLAVMASMENWVQFEAAALVNRTRKELGIAGGTPPIPTYWVACEPAKVDLWIGGDTDAAAVEFKAIHNNKNFYSKVREIRRDLDKDCKALPKDAPKGTERWGVIVATYVRYAQQSGHRYQVLRGDPGEAPMEATDFMDKLRSALKDDQDWYGGYRALEVRKERLICDLSTAHYVDTKEKSGVSLLLVRPL